MAAKSGKEHIEKAVKYILEPDARQGRQREPIWILGVEHPGAQDHSRASSPEPKSKKGHAHTRLIDLSHGPQWPEEFYYDYTSRLWMAYRSDFAPIPDSFLRELEAPSSKSPSDRMPGSMPTIDTGLTCDTGWGCMLRTSQSLLANTLVHLHLGRDWRRPQAAQRTAEYATYVQIVSWFMDTPSPKAPFSVHRMALAGKDLGKGVGQWFGPATAAGAIKTLVQAFPDAKLGVALSEDSSLYQVDVYEASGGTDAWGKKPVLVLMGLRLGLEDVNPLYHETIKMLFTLPQTVGIAGGRPSSSYYFVGFQADSLFYLDPHYTRPAVSFKDKTPVADTEAEAETDEPAEEQLTPEQAYFVDAYTPEELGTYHCDQPKKLLLSSLDPSMLLGFLVRDEADWKDLRERLGKLPQTIFSVVDERPQWDACDFDDDEDGF
ncbi:hypothetical protein CYLTODRAFT_395071 [Cylindrobasidium torrendii FP15055 ss-10]|uniref:Cysteine protease n=1 Tax=Cylindrobasidium torrendii FP15055 ss-10 TaxID=1314674 RepID=A0A0D7BDY4_9AGAR|nr:hypothetical protein CYLTODRAFT_395071 [Cylindrobasidium torrendii FP15055 ss-10]